MGDHTDYNDGFVLPVAIDRECTVTLEPGDNAIIRALSAQLAGSVTVSPDGSTDPSAVEPVWGRFVAGVVRVLCERGAALSGADLQISSSIPPGSGLSSSAALCVALTLALADRGGVVLDGVDAARLARTAEFEATGVPCGLMDQLAALFGRAGHALLIDCRVPTITPTAISDRVAIVVVHSGLPRALAGSAYAERRAECESVARRLGIAALRDATLDDVRDEPRARHVVTENARVQASARALAGGALDDLGALFLESHASLRDDYDVSTPELDALVESLVQGGAAGARLTGAGFGGCVVAVAAPDEAERVLRDSMAAYRERVRLEPTGFVARAVDGAATSAREAAPSSARTPRR
jgi:galactokinase